ncbi:MAG: 30S ribosomal protein S9 [Candidatus Doudnabacteria bacterium]|nr:30S ribosomal protein S9 [Candidatus Doudnabacteria bacterium]
MQAKKPVHRKTDRPTRVRKPKLEAPPAKQATLETDAPKENTQFAVSKSVYAVGKRKTAVAQILITSGDGAININNVPFETYFSTQELQSIARQPLAALGLANSLNIKAKIHSGGIHAQSEAFRHAVSRAITSINPESRRTLKKLGFLTRDPRVKERKKPGLKRARRAPQFSKR